jgi:NADPH:quinone reductase-like Zn-dependent oxidoreductase
MKTYKSLMVTRRGGPQALQFVEQELRPPAGGEARIRILATPVCQDDIAIRVGNRPFLKKPPFSPGYAFIGVVEALGAGVQGLAVGDRVGALTQFGSHSEVIYWPAEALVPVPTELDPAEAAPLLLNYLVAYQILHRVAKVKPGDKVLIIGASGGVGTAFLQLGKLAGLQMYGLASASKHGILREYGAVPLDYSSQDYVQILQETEPQGLDFVFNGMGEETFGPSLAVLKRGGVLVHYGGPQSFTRFLLLVVKMIGTNLLPNGKTIKGYGTHREGLVQMKEDWAELFRLLGTGQIQPVIARRMPLLEAVQAHALLESGQVTGNLVLLAPEVAEPELAAQKQPAQAAVHQGKQDEHAG